MLQRTIDEEKLLIAHRASLFRSAKAGPEVGSSFSGAQAHRLLTGQHTILDVAIHTYALSRSAAVNVTPSCGRSKSRFGPLWR